MSDHLNDIDFEDYLQKGSAGLSEDRLRHLETCPQCQVHLNSQLEMNTLLKHVSPLASDPRLFRKVLGKIRFGEQGTQSVPRTDWFFIGSMIALVIIVATLFITQSIPETFSIGWPRLLPFLEQPVQSIAEKLQGIDVLKDIHPVQNLQITGRYTIFIVAVLIIVLYYLLDKVIIQRLVHR